MTSIEGYFGITKGSGMAGKAWRGEWRENEENGQERRAEWKEVKEEDCLMYKINVFQWSGAMREKDRTRDWAQGKRWDREGQRKLGMKSTSGGGMEGDEWKDEVGQGHGDIFKDDGQVFKTRAVL